ncbi:hypothetical protein EON81_08970 [bacterium]|nr:MAG: hypothetical protein EON81_08970 [bacterium]
MKTLYAAFEDAHKAESAAEALLHAGAQAKDISLVASERARRTLEKPTADNQSPMTPLRMEQMGIDPLGNHLRSGPGIIGGGTISESSTGATNANAAEVGDDLNPAQNDYPRTGSDSTTELSSRPPNASQDFNPDLDKREYVKDYDKEADHELHKSIDQDLARRNELARTPESDAGPLETANDVTHRTIADPATTAKRTAVIGLGVGALAAASAIAIPGFGLILGGGALAAAAAGIAASRGNEEVAGGVAGWLQENGVPADAIPDFRAAYEGNGAIITLNEGLVGADDLLRKQGATHVGWYELG